MQEYAKDLLCLKHRQERNGLHQLAINDQLLVLIQQAAELQELATQCSVVWAGMRRRHYQEEERLHSQIEQEKVRQN